MFAIPYSEFKGPNIYVNYVRHCRFADFNGTDACVL